MILDGIIKPFLTPVLVFLHLPQNQMWELIIFFKIEIDLNLRETIVKALKRERDG